MNRRDIFTCVAAILALTAVVFAQGEAPQPTGPSYKSQPYVPVVPAPNSSSYYGGYGGYGGGGGTVAGNALNGLGSAMSAAGSMHLANSAAAVNLTQAQKNEIQNRQLGASTYFQMRETRIKPGRRSNAARRRRKSS